MQTSSPDILNLLLGIAPMQTATGPVPSGESQPAAVLFGDLMNAALGSARATSADPRQAIGSMPPGMGETEKPEFTALYEPRVTAMMPGKAAVQSMDAAAVFSGNTIPGWDFDAPQVMPTEPAKVSFSGEQPMMQSGERTVLPFGMMPMGAPMMPGEAIPVEMLPVGEYVITKSSIHNGQLTLDIVAKDALSDMKQPTIRITLPLADFAETANPKTALPNSTARTQLDGVPSQPKLEAWFGKLNLKELVITSTNGNNQASVSPEKTSSAPCKFEILAENAGRDVALVTTPAGSDIKIRSLQNRTARPESIETNGLPGRSGSSAPRVAVATPDTADGRFAGENQLPFERDSRFLPLAAKGKTVEQKTDVMPTLSESTRTAADSAMSRERVEAMPARFSLPDNVRTALKPNGHSVQLKIDPEHLGPARLNLIMREEHLSARVVVDSAQAKQAIEGSLDRLVETLARADIKVDSIEVAVGQQGEREGWFAQQGSQRARFVRTGHFKGIENESAAVPAAIAMGTSPSYIGAGGVNVLA